MSKASTRFADRGLRASRILFLVLVFSLSGLSIAGLSSGGTDATPSTQNDFDVGPLVEQIAHSKSIGVFTKLALKQDGKDLFKKMGNYHSGVGDSSLEELHERYNVMVHKLVIVIGKKDEELAGYVADARDKLWDVLSDDIKFSNM